MVSVIIPVFNGLPDLDVQLAALEAQDYVGEFEVIISDNGSTDGVREHLNEHSFAMDLRLVDSSGKKGTPYARNAGIAAAQGEFLVFTDQDDAVHSNWLTALTRAAPDFDAVGGSLEIESLNAPDVATWRVVPKPDERFETGFLPFAHGNNFAMWRRVVDNIGNFDEDFVGGGEDVDYSWRIQQAGMTLGHVPDAVVAYRLRATVRAAFQQGCGYGRTAREVFRKHENLGAKQPTLRLLLAFAYALVIRNPLLPRICSPMPTGSWAISAGSLYGTTRMLALYALRDQFSRR